MATLTTQTSSLGSEGITMSSAAGGGDEYTPGDRVHFLVHNGSGSDVDVTFASQVTASPGVASADHVVTVPANESAIIPLEEASRFKDGNGRVQVTYEATTDVKVAAVQVS